MKSIFKITLLAAVAESSMGSVLKHDMQFADAYQHDHDNLLSVVKEHLAEANCTTCKHHDSCSMKQLAEGTYKLPAVYGISGYSKHMHSIAKLIDTFIDDHSIDDIDALENMTEDHEDELQHLITTNIALINAGIDV